MYCLVFVIVKQDLRKLKSTMENLQKKRSFFESQMNYYKMYVKACLDNLATQKRSVSY